jgi:hypothetical protein
VPLKSLLHLVAFFSLFNKANLRRRHQHDHEATSIAAMTDYDNSYDDDAVIVFTNKHP